MWKKILPKNNSFFNFFAFACILLFAACTVSPSPKADQKQLVKDDAKVFDKRFKEISFTDLNLKDFWENGISNIDREAVPINNKTFAKVLSEVKDGVVNIYALQVQEHDARFGISPSDLLPLKIPIISSLMDIIPFKVPVPYKSQGISLGSGFIINSKGYILTNAHVVFNAVDIRVVLAGGQKEIPARIIGMDSLTDTALLKVEAGFPMHSLPLGYSDEIQVGEMVIAIGNPLGLNHTITSGLISANDRYVPGKKSHAVNFIQTDSAINPGSSGGPLINMYGEVVGINTAIISDAQLVGFAVPVDTVREVLPMLVLGKTERGWFGASVGPLKSKDAISSGYNKETGIVVNEVKKESPAEISGLKPMDIIIEMNNLPMDSFNLFRRKLLGMSPGEKIEMIVFRQGELVKISSALIEKSVEPKE
ncbi:MAG: S1C family serine protease [Nitrospinales bacterium]